MATIRKLVCLGDSLTEGFGDALCLGWAGRVVQAVAARTHGREVWSLCNGGVGAETILDGKHRLASALATMAPSHLILAYGANECATIMWPEDTGPKVSLAFAKKTWLLVFDQMKATRVKCAVVGLLPVDEARMPFTFMPTDATDYGYFFKNERLRDCNNMLRDLCARKNLPFVDLFEKWQALDLGRLLCDGLHPGTEGYEILARQIDESLGEQGFWK